MRRALLCFFALIFCRALASAHPLLQNVLWVKFAPERVQVAVDVSVREIALAEHFPVGLEIQAVDEGLTQAAERHRTYVLKHLQLSAEGRALEGRVLRVTPPAQFGFVEETRYQYEIEYLLEARPPAGEVSFQEDALKEISYAPGQAWDVSYNVRFEPYGATELATALLTSRQPLILPTGLAPEKSTVSVSAARTFGEYFGHGVMHILTGYDHLLFVSALVLAAMSFWEMVKVIAAFTLAHTLTLTLSVFNILRLPSFIVEPVISASIIFVAVENIFWPGRAKSWVRLAVAFGFGLVHGLGFAGGLLDAMEGLPVLSLGLALLAFSIGVEVGHQVVVLPLFGALRFGQARCSEGFRAALLRYGSACISLAGLYYFVDALRNTMGTA
jgi:hydrogenase/urease accessory protein HupE